MNTFFALCLTEHHRWGYILSAHILEVCPEKDYFRIHDFVSGNNLPQYKNLLNEAQIKMVSRIDQCSENEMARALRRKTNARDFVKSLTDEMIADEVRPYIERRMLHCFDLLTESGTRLFLKDNSERIYHESEIFYTEEPAEAIFNFNYQTEDGLKYFLSVRYRGEEISLLGKRFIPLVNQPSVVVAGNNLLQFKDIDSKKFTPFVTKSHISIPKNVEDKYFQTFVVENIRNIVRMCRVFPL